MFFSLFRPTFCYCTNCARVYAPQTAHKHKQERIRFRLCLRCNCMGPSSLLSSCRQHEQGVHLTSAEVVHNTEPLLRAHFQPARPSKFMKDKILHFQDYLLNLFFLFQQTKFFTSTGWRSRVP